MFQAEDFKGMTGAGNTISSQLLLAFIFTYPIYVLFYIRERATGAKHLQFVSGVDVLIFWLVSFICDFCIVLISSACILAIFKFYAVEGYSTIDELGSIYTIWK